jgi:hypothetical protein
MQDIPEEECFISLDQHAVHGIALKKFAQSPDAAQQQFLSVLEPQFRLMQIAKQACDMSIDTNVAYLTAPLHIGAKPDDSDDAEPSPSFCLSIFHAINWLRELLNSFAASDDTAIRDLVAQRVAHVPMLEESFAAMMSKTDWTPPHSLDQEATEATAKQSSPKPYVCTESECTL